MNSMQCQSDFDELGSTSPWVMFKERRVLLRGKVATSLLIFFFVMVKFLSPPGLTMAHMLRGKTVDRGVVECCKKVHIYEFIQFSSRRLSSYTRTVLLRSSIVNCSRSSSFNLLLSSRSSSCVRLSPHRGTRRISINLDTNP